MELGTLDCNYLWTDNISIVTTMAQPGLERLLGLRACISAQIFTTRVSETGSVFSGSV